MITAKDIFVICFVFALLSVSFIQVMNNRQLQESNQMYKRLVEINAESYSTNLDSAKKYYELASLSYENNDFLDCEQNCKLARDSYTLYIQELKALQVKIQDYPEEVFDIYRQLLAEEIIMYENMYEACEWFETASRRYNYYFQETTPENDKSFDDGNAAIEEMNEKIANHDDAVRRYNYLLEQYKAEVNKIINNP